VKRELLDLLVDPATGGSLTLDPASRAEDGSVTEGALRSSSGERYLIRASIPRFVRTDDAGQLQTSTSFGYKWGRRESYEDAAAIESYRGWLLAKYGFASAEEWASYFDGKRRVLDVGCGSGYSSALWLDSPGWKGRAMWVGVDISEAIDVARERLGAIPNTHFVQADALRMPFEPGTFDAIFSEGVLHHTPSTRDALLASARLLAPGGAFHFYVYRKKAPVREFTDDHVRAAIAGMTNDEAWEAMRPLTRLARDLVALHATVEVDDIPVLGIKAGRYDVQRLIYWSFAKLFWNEAYPFEANLHVNFDWYRPHYANRQTEAEVRAWCAEAGLRVDRLHEEESGFTVIASRHA
jgi:SAM-dependent methyltransferase